MDLRKFIEEKVSERWQNLSFLGRTHKRVPIPKVGTGTHCVGGIWYRYQKFGYRYPFTSKGLVPVPIKVVPIPMLPTTLIFVPLHCYVPYLYTDSIGILIND